MFILYFGAQLYSEKKAQLMTISKLNHDFDKFMIPQNKRAEIIAELRERRTIDESEYERIMIIKGGLTPKLSVK